MTKRLRTPDRIKVPIIPSKNQIIEHNLISIPFLKRYPYNLKLGHELKYKYNINMTFQAGDVNPNNFGNSTFNS